MDGRRKRRQREDPRNAKLPALADLGVTKTQSSRWQKLAELGDDDFEARAGRGEETRGAADRNAGVRRIRGMAEAKRQDVLEPEDTPGPGLTRKDALKQFVREHAWGHPASWTCPIGPRDQRGVLASDFRAHGTRRLKIVDASVFPRIPGFFIVCPIYMIAEKAADVILAAAAPETHAPSNEAGPRANSQ